MVDSGDCNPRLRNGRPYGAVRWAQLYLWPRGVAPPATKRAPLRGYVSGSMVRGGPVGTTFISMR